MRTALLLLGALLPLAGMAAPLIDEPVPTLTLTDGRVLHDAQARAFGTKTVMTRHSEGAETIPYDLFPADYQAALTARRPRERSHAEIAEAKARAEQNAPKPRKKAADARRRIVNGCVLNYATPAGQLAKLSLTNTTSRTQSVWPSNFIGTSIDGSVAEGFRWVGLNNKGDIAVVLRSNQVLAAGETVELGLMFERFRGSPIVASVDWK